MESGQVSQSGDNSTTSSCVCSDWDVWDPGLWSQWWDGECCAGGISDGGIAAINGVGDFIADDDAIRLLRGAPGEDHGVEIQHASKVAHTSRN